MLGVGVLFFSVVLGFGTVASNAAEVAPAADQAAGDRAAADKTQDLPSEKPKKISSPKQSSARSAALGEATPPYGAAFPVKLETNFSRPYRSVSTDENGDYSLLDDLERLIQGSYQDPEGNARSDAASNEVNLSISRMENSVRVWRELIKAAEAGVKVRVIHGVATQTVESKALQSALNSSKMRDADFKICEKGKSMACLSDLSGAIMHSKLLRVSSTYDRDGNPAKGVVWSGSANLGGASGEKTYNNGLIVYNDQKLWNQTSQMWADMTAERDINNDYLEYIKAHPTSYGLAGGTANGYSNDYATRGMFYSNLANVTIYPTPIYATPDNGKDPVINLLDRVVPDDQCRIRLQENRFKYRRIGVAQKLVELVNDGCKVSVVGFEDDLAANKLLHCQQLIRVCRPILDVFKTANRQIDAAWAKPHDKTIMVDAVLKPNTLNTEELLPNGEQWPADGSRQKLVLAGSAALTGSNLIVSDEITTETTDPAVYDDYLEHWRAINVSFEHEFFAY